MINGRCLKCGMELGSGDTDNICISCKLKDLKINFEKFYKEDDNIIPTQYGWICPRCGKVHAPFVRECDCPPPCITTTGINTSIG
jgi:hypothetical protein